ncbi:MAG: glycosyltransferase involved in cell wall biosynthesis [Mariniflexile sp.]|jgi:glycosyltransferase involved in cell wall biosynthesis
MITSVYEKLLLIDNPPLISIIICTYNRAEYLNTCINSIINQSNKNWELIIVDDGSDDNTFEIVNGYLIKYSNIRYVKHQNIKLALSRNIGLLLSLGKYITFLDSDDTFKENHIESRLDFMTQNPLIDLIYGGVELNEEIFVADYYKPGKLINVENCVLGSTFFGKRKVFFEIAGYNNLNYGEDTEFLERAEKKFNVHKLAEPKTYIYTRAQNSISMTKSIF